MSETELYGRDRIIRFWDNDFQYLGHAIAPYALLPAVEGRVYLNDLPNSPVSETECEKGVSISLPNGWVGRIVGRWMWDYRVSYTAVRYDVWLSEHILPINKFAETLDWDGSTSDGQWL